VQTSAAETRRIFAAVHGDKQLWLVDGAAHVNLYRYAGQEYARRVGGFLKTHLQQASFVLRNRSGAS